MNLRIDETDEARAAALEKYLLTCPEWRPALLATEPRNRGVCIARIVWAMGLELLETAKKGAGA